MELVIGTRVSKTLGTLETRGIYHDGGKILGWGWVGEPMRLRPESVRLWEPLTPGESIMMVVRSWGGVGWGNP